MNRFLVSVVALLSALPFFAQDPVVWHLDNLQFIGAIQPTIWGSPSVVDEDGIHAIEFDGIDDGLFLNTNPLSGANEFTIEVIFKPYAGGTFEQRFVHVQQDENNRMLIELRSAVNDTWYLDTYIKSKGVGLALINSTLVHSNSQWHHAALLYKNGIMSHFVDGVLEMEGHIEYSPQTSGSVSLGVRQNKISWYKGAIRYVRFSPRALSSDLFMNPQGITNSVSETDSKDLDSNCFFSIQSVVPNPVKNHLMLNMWIGLSGLVDISFTSILGQESFVCRQEWLNCGLHQLALDVGHFSEGVYLMNVTLNGVRFSKKIVISGGV